MSRAAYLTGIAAALALAAGALGAAETGAPDANWTYPVWLSPVLDLESIDKIDARLARPLEAFARIGVAREDVKGARVEVRNCLNLRELAAEGYRPDAGEDAYMLGIQKTTCDALRMLKAAKPARLSYVRLFVLNGAALNHLPARIDPSIACRADGRLPGGDLSLMSWREFQGGVEVASGRPGPLAITLRDDGEMTVRAGKAEVTFEILARGDLDGDGYEDLLMRVSRDVSRAAPGTAAVFMLTRDGPDGMLRVVDDRCR